MKFSQMFRLLFRITFLSEVARGTWQANVLYCHLTNAKISIPDKAQRLFKESIVLYIHLDGGKPLLTHCTRRTLPFLATGEIIADYKHIGIP